MHYCTHKANWGHCSDCFLQETRGRVVLFKGSIPSDILFIGEAPGTSENVIGKPFVGPAGKLLNRIIEEANPDTLRLGFTNLLACIPYDETRTKVSQPPKSSIKACKPRLTELLTLCEPKAIVSVGRLPRKHLQNLPAFQDTPFIDIIHPAAILRMDVSQKGLAIQRTTVILSDLFDTMPF